MELAIVGLAMKPKGTAVPLAIVADAVARSRMLHKQQSNEVNRQLKVGAPVLRRIHSVSAFA